MDKRKYKRIALLTALFLLTAAVECIIFYQAFAKIREIEWERLETLVQKERDSTRTAGTALQEKYGYYLLSSSSRDIMNGYAAAAVLVFLLSGAAILIIFLKCFNEQKVMMNKLELLQEHLHNLQLHHENVKSRIEKEENDTKILITDISHQLKTPISSLKMSYDIVNTTVLSNEEKQSLHDKELEEIKKLEMLLNSLINLSKLETRLIQIRPVPGSLKETLLKAINSVYMKAYEKQIDISTAVFEDRQILHDTKWTSEAFVNILDNAIKYSPKASTIHIDISELYSNMLIEVTDEGIGIPVKEAHKVFKRFYRGTGKAVQTQEGSGVGLYLARKILEEQGGSISVKSGIEKGSIFRVTLPKINETIS